MNKKLNDLLSSIERKMQPGEDDSTGPLAFPHWSHNKRAIPNGLARSALFKASAKGATRRMVQEEKIVALDGISIHFTGIELSQDDCDVFLQLVHMARGSLSHEKIRTTGYELLKGLDWATTSLYYDRLKECIRRLSAATIRLEMKRKHGKFEYGGGILAYKLVERDDKPLDLAELLDEDFSGPSILEITLDENIATLFASDLYTQIDWDQRQELPPLAKWLHAFYHTHANPYTYKVETLHKLCGSSSAELKSFRQKLKQAMDLLKASGFLENWSYDKAADSITVLRARNISK